VEEVPLSQALHRVEALLVNSNSSPLERLGSLGLLG
jgi:hypothetical protein